ncbi:type III-A CRISPR-associated protein Csm2 [Paratractidigestivibacter sp.]|uniref:type III-A CRISPR-associated protein Csm2 n=1 Tax=Paratractidigestivibacter sp. TaxID=2847316 RepID=UPI002ACB0A68|nr:type III-A CRISPR-associated protein Csm2 [Paratractidigestivibacter sp.]
MKSMVNSSVTLHLTPKTAISGGNYAQTAEVIVSSAKNGGQDSWFKSLSMSKLRGIYGLITNVYTRVNKPEDLEANMGDLQYIKVKMAYEAGREKAVKDFLSSTGLMNALDDVKTYDQFILYCRYAESLVAYFKFYGGREYGGRE